ncbi:MAG: DUF6249 domain-containing protein [Bacteroidales bacterium]|nr:DUF6249 domain-containing protein [Bacteroidales bacterium]
MTHVEILVPIFVCVVLPVAIVLIVSLYKRAETNRKAEVMIKAIESGATVDPSFFKDSGKPKSTKEKLLERLTTSFVTGGMGIALLVLGAIFCTRTTDWEFGDIESLILIAGGVLLAVGVANFISYKAGVKMFAKEMEAEGKEAEEEIQG